MNRKIAFFVNQCAEFKNFIPPKQNELPTPMDMKVHKFPVDPCAIEVLSTWVLTHTCAMLNCEGFEVCLAARHRRCGHIAHKCSRNNKINICPFVAIPRARWKRARRPEMISSRKVNLGWERRDFVPYIQSGHITEEIRMIFNIRTSKSVLHI